MPVIVPAEGVPQIVDPAVDLPAYQSGDPAALVAQATALVRRYCGWHVTPAISETVTVNSSGSVLMLPSLRVGAVTAVIDPDGVAVDATTYKLRAPGHIVLTSGGSWAAGAYTVTMAHGFDTAPEVATVIMALATRAQASPNGGFVRQVGQVAYQVPNGDGGVSLLESEKATLDLYRLPPRP